MSQNSRAEGAPRPVPDFLLAGHPKCGTTALYEMLRLHPQIFMPDVKEPRFFAPDVIQSTRNLEQYRELFAGAEPSQVVGEADPNTLASRVAPAAIAAQNPAARMVAIFREPATFLHSLHLQRLRSRPETPRDLRQALDFYTDFTHYCEQLQRYRAALSEEQILVLIYDDFRRDNPGTLRRVLEFLGVDPDYPVHTVEANPSVAIRPAADKVLRATLSAQGPVARSAKRALRAVTPLSARRAAILAFRKRVVRAAPPPPDEALLAELRDRFKPEVVQFGDLLGRDLVTLWGY